ncbi:MAG: hypothetical protein IT196_11705, partial [Acidimicrobiales bacterium]|nr:hypothetical protein [Acidimicrobiales bacterium]
MAPYGERAVRFSEQMSDAEALMWNVEKDPWLASTMGTVALTDRPLDAALFRARIAAAVASIPRLRARAMPRLGRLTPPSWQPDPEFDLDYHLCHLALPAPGDRAALLTLAARLLEDPFDRTRPLWRFFVIEGLQDGRGALVVKLHHSLTDGLGAIRLAEQYMDLERTTAAPPPVDLDAVLAADLAAQAAGAADEVPGPEASAARADGAPGASAGEGLTDLLGSLLGGAGHAARRPAGLARRLAGDALLAFADPSRVPERTEELWGTVRNGLAQLDPRGPGAQSPLWGRRSRRRTQRTLDLDHDAAKSAAKALGVSLNDLFV